MRRLTLGSRAPVIALLSALAVSCSSTEGFDPPATTFTDSLTASADMSDPREGGAKANGPGSDRRKVPTAEAAASAESTNEKPAESVVAASEADRPPAASADKETPAAAKAVADNPSGQVLTNGGPILTAGAMPSAPQETTKKKGFLSSFFGSQTADAAPAPAPINAAKAAGLSAAMNEPGAATSAAAAKPARPEIAQPETVKQVKLAAAGSMTKHRPIAEDSGGEDFLPGVRREGLFEITRKSGNLNDDSDIDVHEDEEGPSVILASAAGMARLAPNGLLKQRESVDVACLKPGLVGILKSVERRFGKKLIVTSGYRSPTYNKRVNGARRSQHMYCAAADVQVPGVSKWELAKFVRSLPGRGGVGTYCHTASVHIDIGPERDWNWRCRKGA